MTRQVWSCVKYHTDSFKSLNRTGLDFMLLITTLKQHNLRTAHDLDHGQSGHLPIWEG